MIRKLAGMILVAMVVVAAGWPAEAQQFRIYTRVYNEAAAHDQPNQKKSAQAPIVHSLSLFHTGKVYDYIREVGEVIIVEPTQRRFTILSTTCELKTTVEFSELQQLVSYARAETENYLAQPQRQGGPPPEVAAALRFQLKPTFDRKYDEKRNVLTLQSPSLKYQARCAEFEPDVVDSYLRYADWICRLNYLLHPQSLFPESRLALNAELRRRGVIPVEVQLQAEIAHNVHLRAEHQIGRSLESTDLKLIHRWETLLKDPQIKSVTFRDYQRTVTLSGPKSRR